jgi:hypothetical protein
LHEAIRNRKKEEISFFFILLSHKSPVTQHKNILFFAEGRKEQEIKNNNKKLDSFEPLKLLLAPYVFPS